MRLLMISGDRSILQGKKSAFYYTLEEFSKHWERIDVICPFLCHGEPCLPGVALAKTGRTIFSNVHFHPSPHGLWYQPWWIVKKGQELIAEHHHEVMTVHEYPPFYNGLGAKWLHQRTGIPYVLEIHHIVGYPKASSLQELIGWWMSRMLLKWDARKAAAVRCVNKETKKVLDEWGLKNVKVVPSFYLDKEVLERCRTSSFETPGLLHARSSGSKTAALRLSNRSYGGKGTPQDDTELHAAPCSKKYDVVFCGRDAPNKGLKEVREAAKNIGARLLAIGTDVWIETKEEVYQAMQSGKVFVMNSKSEGGPRVLLEAMALGLPVIATRVGIAPDVIEDGVNGMFTTGEVRDLGQKIQRLLSNEDLCRTMGENAKKVLEKFNKEDLVRGYADFLKKFSPSPEGGGQGEGI